jgi:hypothetical protein
MPVTWTGRHSGEEEDDEEEEEDVAMDDMEVDGGALPETDLLSALDEQLGNVPAAKPESEGAAEIVEATTSATPSTEPTTSKRAAAAAPEPAVPAKRLRASPVAEAVAKTSPQGLPGPDPATARAPVPTTVVTRSAKAQQTVTLPAQTTPAAAADDADDGSDFEMPPLTMESSGDEDDGEDEEDDA